jgi:beta-galactosidase
MSKGLTRRTFLGDAALVGVASMAGLQHVLADEVHATGSSVPQRRTSFDAGWSFTRGDIINAQSPDYSGGNWTALDLPHDWGITGPFSEDAPSGSTGAYLPTGIGWYRKIFRLSESSAGRRISLQFDGVYQCSDVWINGHHLGYRPYGFATFYYDLTPYLHFGSQPNVVAVRVDNSHQPNLRWYSGSGIYRHTWLINTGPVYVEQWGTFVTTPQITQDKAVVEVTTRVRNDTRKSAPCTLTTSIVGQDGVSVQSEETKIGVAAGENYVVIQRLTVSNPRLWSVATPNLYTARQVLNHEDKQADAVATSFGIRSIEFNVDKGFLLNGEHVKLNGVCVHDDGGAVGVAVPARIWERRFELLKAMGCNAIRTSHNPHVPEFLDLCDKMGFLVMAEAFDEWREPKEQTPEFGYHRYFDEWAARDLTDMILRDRNHPSIVIWSAGNEIPDQIVQRGSETLGELMNILHSMDPTRPVTVACDRIAAEPEGARPEFLAPLDIVGYNYVGRWRDRREKLYSVDRRDFPQRRMIGTENGAMPGYYPGGSAHSSFRRFESSLRISTEQLQRFTQINDYVIGDFMWTGISYLGEAKWPSKGANSGVLDTCGFTHDGYYFYQSLWTKTPVLHLSGHWNWASKEGEIISVLCYTNCDTVELFLNGKSLGVQGYVFPETGMQGHYGNMPLRDRGVQTTGDLHLAWYVPYQPGTLKAVGTKNGETVMTVEQTTTGAPAAIRLSADRTQIGTDWDDLSHVKVEIVDAKGCVVPTADCEVVFALNGPGRILGLDNGDSESHESYQGDRRHAYGGRALALVQSSGRPGTMRLSATSPSLTGAEIVITST